jgi:hypothetical protein
MSDKPKERVKCAECDGKSNPESYGKCTVRTVMEERGLCFSCAFWHDLARLPDSKGTVIAGRIYSVGQEPRKGGRAGLGFGGRRFDIRYLADGRTLTTRNLWAGSKVPEKWLKEFPDTAEFLNGAGECQVGDTTCWDESGT